MANLGVCYEQSEEAYGLELGIWFANTKMWADNCGSYSSSSSSRRGFVASITAKVSGALATAAKTKASALSTDVTTFNAAQNTVKATKTTYAALTILSATAATLAAVVPEVMNPIVWTVQDKDIGKAVEWYEKAAEKGINDAMYNLGYCYERRDDVARDIAKAREWYTKAATASDEDTVRELWGLDQNHLMAASAVNIYAPPVGSLICQMAARNPRPRRFHDIPPPR